MKDLKATHVLNHENTEMIAKHHNTDFVQIPPRTEARLVTKRKNAIGWHKRPIATRFHVSLFADERVEFSLCTFNLWPLNPATLKKPIQYLPKEVESRTTITSNDDIRTKAAQSLSNWRTIGNCREDGAHKILEQATTVFAEIFSVEASIYLLKGW